MTVAIMEPAALAVRRTDLVLMSHSQRTSWLRCPNQFRLRKAKFPTKPSMSLIAGSAYHSATDVIDYRLWEGDVPPVEDAQRIWRECFAVELADAAAREPDMGKWQVSGRRTKDKPDKENAAWWLSAGADMLAGYVGYRVDEMARGIDIWDLPDGSPAIEVHFEFELNGTLQRGSIDRIMQMSGEPILIRDTKTSQREPDDSSQLGLYKVAVARTFGVEIEWGDYFMARTGEATMPTSLLHYTEALFAREAGYIAQAKTLQLYPSNPGSICGTCDVKDGCAIKGGVSSEQWLTVMPT